MSSRIQKPRPCVPDDQIVVVDHQVADRRGRHVQPQRLPIVAIVERNINGPLRSGEEQALAHRIFAHRVDRPIRQAADDLLPGFAAVVRAVDVRLQIVEAEAVDGGVDGLVVEVRRVKLRDFAPRRESPAA